MKVLCIINQDIVHVKSGGGQCAKRNYDAVKASLNAEDEVYTCIIADNISKKATKNELYIPGLEGNIQKVIAAFSGRKCYRRIYEKDIKEFIEEVRPDVVYLDTSKLGILARYIKEKYACRIIVFFHNVESDYSWNFVRNKGVQFLPAYCASLVNERHAVKYADEIICLNGRDRNRIEELYKRTPANVIPISMCDGFDIKKLQLDKKKGLLFIGSFFPPNYHGIKWFVEEVMSKLPDQKLTIVGKNFEMAREELERPNVNVIGTVDDLSEYYYTYPAVVMPIQYGSGMKVKTCEAMMYGKHIFASDEALEGYDIEGVREIERCNTANEYIKAICDYFDGTEILSYACDVRECYVENYCTDRLVNRFKKCIRGY